MKYDQLRAFEKHLESAFPNHFSNLYMIIAKSEEAGKVVVGNLLRFLLKGYSRDLCLSHFDGNQLKIGEVIAELNTSSFLVDRRVILIEHGEKLSKAETEVLQGYIAQPNRSNYLVIALSSINRGTNFYKKSEKEGVIFDQGEEKPWEKEKRMQDWVLVQIREQGKQAQPQACQCLVKQVGVDQQLIQQEIDKLVCYVGERPEITVQDIGTICISVNIETIWQLGEAIFCRDPNAALRIMKGQLADGAAFLVLLRQIRNQFQTEFQICSILANGGSSQDVASEYPYMKGQILERHVGMARSYGMERFKMAMLAIDEAEMMAKNSLAELSWIAEQLIIRLTTNNPI